MYLCIYDWIYMYLCMYVYIYICICIGLDESDVEVEIDNTIDCNNKKNLFLGDIQSNKDQSRSFECQEDLPSSTFIHVKIHTYMID
jgi:hypothetical protein